MSLWANFVIGVIIVTASAYTPVECGGSLAADGTACKAGCTVAVSRDLKHLMGKVIHIEGVGKRRVNDLMNARWKQAIDVYMSTTREAKEFGRRELAIKVMR